MCIRDSNTGSGEGHDAQCKLTGLAVRVKVDIAEGCACGFQNFLGGGDVVRVAVQCLGIDADDLAALLLDALVECVKVIHLIHAGLAAAEPEVYNGERIVGKQAAVNAVAVKVLTLKLREGAAVLRCALAAGFILRKGCDLIFDFPDLISVRFEGGVLFLGELILHKVEGGKNDLLDRIAADSAFGVTREELEGIMKPENFVGRAPQQTQEFVDNEIQPILDKYSDLLGLDVEIKV